MTDHILPNVDGKQKISIIREGKEISVEYWDIRIDDIFSYENKKYKIINIHGLSDGNVEIECELLQNPIPSIVNLGYN